MEILGYIGALLVGVTLGLLGAGGSILTVPVLYYLFGVDAELSTAYSLFIVGITALTGAIPNMRKGLVSYKTAIVFAIPSMLAVYITRAYILPGIPDYLFTAGDTVITKDIGIVLFFSIIMIAAALSMIIHGKRNPDTIEARLRFNYPVIIIEGIVVGVLTGMVGAGGGFLIIPALVLFARLPMKLAIGTSLLIIAFKSLFGFLGDIQSGQPIDWMFMLLFSAITVAGILLGTYLTNFVDGRKLKGAFGYFVLLMGAYIIIRELFLKV
ncbi:MAG: sulfite exporter TauE/SafE family protein [Bacteroidetes bacterium]|nr:sulfite exporter TauE/SafE family protein [Bacteroidota bacterium]MBP7400597.1 sulfite exporter TauE/SafE family protein [Chitinophagales bacterium]MBK7108773.1 sulfite exporter TauE/SafE family protein [Bacteroidota bacterium]MBK8488901.1 sulfite exporter TauE/SafE family protein [Bacteroidota bacterium]MBK8680751.1 sulfite exporter TauE/SafE family protein [Bacteroidota bacterium]